MRKPIRSFERLFKCNTLGKAGYVWLSYNNVILAYCEKNKGWYELWFAESYYDAMRFLIRCKKICNKRKKQK